jgi:aspartate-semialdehyde dehydrogenase
MPPSPHVAILGCTGAVGAETLRILEQRNFPLASLKLLASSRSAGKHAIFRGSSLPIQELNADSFKGVDLAFFAAGSDTSKQFAPIARAAGCTIIDKTSAFRATPEIPLVIPEVNAHALRNLPRGSIVAVPNCSTIILLIALEPLRASLGIERVVVSTYQAASGAGAAAMDELESQTRDVLAGKPAIPRVFKEPCALNIFSHDSAIDPRSGSNAEEAKFTSETRRIWNDPAIRINATCVRVGVMRSHSESVCLTLKKPATESHIRDLLAKGRALTIIDDRANNKFPTPLKAANGDTVLIGRIRPDETQDTTSSTGGGQDAAAAQHDQPHRGYNLFISGDQLRLGAALTAVKIAELLLAR